MATRLPILKQKYFWIIVLLVVTPVLIFPLISVASPAMNQYLLPANPLGNLSGGPSTGPNSIVAGSDGNVWFAEQYANRIGKINPATHAISEYDLQRSSSGSTTLPSSIVAGPDGNLWFAQSNGPDTYGDIGKITPSGTIKEYPVTSSVPYPHSLAFGPDGNIWYTTGSSGIGVMDTNGNMLHSYATASYASSSVSRGICAGPDGNMWFADGYNTIAKINPSTGAISTYGASLPQPMSLVSGPGGNVWFAGAGSFLNKIDPNTHVVTTYNIPVPPRTATISQYGGPFVLGVGPDGNLWYPLPAYGVGTYNVSSGTFAEYEAHDYGSGPSGDAVGNGPDGNIWFTSFTNEPTVGDVVINTGGGTSSNVAPSFTSAKSVSVASGSSLDFMVTTTGMPAASISVSGSLPSGITFKNNGNGTATLSGSAKVSSTETVDLKFTATNAAGSTTQSFTLTIATAGDCKTVPATNNSTSSCSATAPGQVGTESATSSYPVPVALNAKDVEVANIGHGNTEAVVAPGLDLSSKDYTVPAKQILYDDGTLGAVTVNGGGTIKGSGDIAHDLIVSKGATLAPGHSPGCINAGGLLLYGTYQAQIGGTSGCAAYDQVNIAGQSVIEGTLQVASANGFVPTTGQEYTVLDSKSISGQFQGQPEGSSLSSQGVTYQISYKNAAVVLKVLSVDGDIQSTATPAINARLADVALPFLISKLGIEFAIFAVGSTLLLGVAIVYEKQKERQG